MYTSALQLDIFALLPQHFPVTPPAYDPEELFSGVAALAQVLTQTEQQPTHTKRKKEKKKENEATVS